MTSLSGVSQSSWTKAYLLRHVSIIRAFGINEPMGCYHDFEHAHDLLALGSNLIDIPSVFEPRSILAILNYIPNHIIQTGRVNEQFDNAHTAIFHRWTDIGCGLRPSPASDDRRRSGAAGPPRFRVSNPDFWKRRPNSTPIPNAPGPAQRDVAGLGRRACSR